MKLHLLKKYLIVASLLISPYLSNAWGLLGHRVVGEIAQSYLTPKAKLEIKKILGNESLAMSSNWLDFVKSDTIYNSFYNWHFINVKAGLTDAELRAYLATDTVVDAYTKIKFMTAELKKKTLPLDQKKIYLRALIHIIGDLHQPLHVGRYEDLGGNKIKVSWFGEPSNLHRVWDDDLIGSQKLSYTEYAAALNFTTLTQRKQWQSEPLAEWIIQSYNLANKIYESAKPEDRLSYRYIYDFLEIANQRLLIGGVRLAGVLNEIYK